MEKFFKVIVSVFAIAWLIKEIIIPLSSAAIFSNKYMKMVYQCDSAMESSWYYGNSNAIPKETEIIELLDCHEYDKLRKVMLISGLPEDYLAWLGLKSLDIYQKNPEEFVKQHRFTQR